jgi:DNA-binding NarL/FixJ family response regulator
MMHTVVRGKSQEQAEGILYARILLVPSKHLGWLALRAMTQNTSSVRLVGEEANAEIAVRLAERTMPDAVLMDVEPRDYPLPVLVRRLQEHCPEAKLLVFAAEPDRRIQSILGELGVGAFLLWEDLTPEALHYALGAVLVGGLCVGSRAAVQELIAGPEHESHPRNMGGGFAEQEREVLGYLAEGLSQREIAARVGMGLRTVERMVKRLEDKCYVNSLRELRSKARSLGFGQ